MQWRKQGGGPNQIIFHLFHHKSSQECPISAWDMSKYSLESCGSNDTLPGPVRPLQGQIWRSKQSGQFEVRTLYLSISIHPSIHLSIYPSIYLFISTHQQSFWSRFDDRNSLQFLQKSPFQCRIELAVFLLTVSSKQIDGQIDRQIDIKIDRQINRQTNRQTYR